jgi:hypothetical protein
MVTENWKFDFTGCLVNGLKILVMPTSLLKQIFERELLSLAQYEYSFQFEYLQVCSMQYIIFYKKRNIPSHNDLNSRWNPLKIIN